MTNEAITLEYKPVSWAYSHRWSDNPNYHDLPRIAKALQKHGFKQTPHYDATLGAIDDGNGRISALNMMEMAGEPAPRGIVVTDGVWTMPIIFGIDAETVAKAKAYALDANNLQLAGREGLDVVDVSLIYDTEKYIELLRELKASGDMPTTVGEDDIERMQDFFEAKELMQEMEASAERGEGGGVDDSVRFIRLTATEPQWIEWRNIISLVGELPAERQTEAILASIDRELLAEYGEVDQ